MALPFNIELYAANLQRLGWLNDALAVSMTVRHNRAGAASITVRSDHVRAAALLTPGARAVLTYYPDDGTPIVLSGLVDGFQTTGPVGTGNGATVRFDIAEDWDVLHALTWPVPANGIGSQTSEFYTATGPAETVIKGIVTANVVTRLGRPLTVPATAGTGATVTVKTRMEDLRAVVSSLADSGGIGVTVTQAPTGWTLATRVPTDRTNITLSTANHTIADWSWTATSPTATRVVVGGGGGGSARVFVARTSSAAESAWGVVREEFVDEASSTDSAELQAAGDKALADSAATSGFAVTLAESSAMTLGKNVQLGDRITLEPLPGYPVEDVLREATVKWTVEDGKVVAPVFGDPDQSDPQRVTASAISSIAAAVKRLRRR